MDLDSLRTSRKRKSKDRLLVACWKVLKQCYFKPTLGYLLAEPAKRKTSRKRCPIPAGGKVLNLPHRLLVLDDGRSILLWAGQDVMIKSGQKVPWFAHIVQIFQYWTVEDLDEEQSTPGRLPQPRTAVFLRWYDRVRASAAKRSKSSEVEAGASAAVVPPLVRLRWANSIDDMKEHYDCIPISTILHPVRVTPDASTPDTFLTDGLVLDE